MTAGGSDPSEPAAYHHDLLGVARGGGLNFAGTFFNQAMRFVTTFLLARLLGGAGVGLYFQAYAFLALLDLVALSGFKKTLTRFVAVHVAERDPGSLRGTLRLGLLLPTLAAVILGTVLFVVAPLVATEAFHDVRLIMPLQVVALALPATVFTDAALSATQGFRTMRPYAFIGLIFEPACRIVLTALLLAAGWGLEGAMIALLITNLAAAALAAASLRRIMSRTKAAPRYSFRELFGFSIASWIATLASAGLLWIDTILLGLYREPSEVGVYQVATRLVLLATIFMQPLGESFAPRVADLYQRADFSSLKELYGLVTSWIVRLSMPAFVILLAFPTDLLTLFGPGFSIAATVTVLLAVGELFDVATGPSGHMLLMSGRPKLTMACNITGLALNVGLNAWLIPHYGIIGAASAWAASLAIINIMRVGFVWVVMRMLPLDFGLLKALPSALIALLIALAVRQITDGPMTLVVGAAAVVLAYALTVALMGLTAEDRFVLTILRRRFDWKGA